MTLAIEERPSPTVATMKGSCPGICKEDAVPLVLTVVGALGVFVGTIVGIAGAAVWAAASSTVPTVVVEPKPHLVAPIVSFAW